MSWILLLLLTLQFSPGFGTTCTYFDIATPDPQTQTGCTWRTYGDQNDFVHFVDGTRYITATYTFKIISTCLSGAAETTFYNLNLFDGATMKTVFRIKRVTLLTFNSYIYDTSGGSALHSSTTISVSGNYVTGAISIDLVTGKVRQLWLTDSAYLFASGTYSFGTWAFRQRSAAPYMLYFGQDDLNSYYTAFSKEYLALAPHIEPYLYTLIQGSKAPLLVGSYSMLENSGYILPDLTGNLGSAYLGGSTATTYSATYAPAMTAAGVRFTQASQYIQLPQPPMSSYSNQLVSLSFSVSFGINLSERSGYIFSRISATSQDLIKLIVNSDGTLKATMNGITLVTSQTPLNVGTWYQVTVFFMFSSNRGAASISLSGTVDTPNNDINPLTSVGSYSEAASDKFIITGFKGILRNFNIYSPGSPRLTDTTCTTSCLLDIGVTQAACIIPACSFNYYVAGTTCVLCDASCLTCSATGNNACLSCEPYKVLNNGVCETPAKIPAYIQRVTQYIINIASLVVGLLRFNTPGPIWFGCLSEILRYVRYLDLINSARLQAILDEPDPEWLSIDYISSAPDKAAEKFVTSIPPINFGKYGLSSSFLLNFWPSKIFLAGIVVVLFLAAIFAYLTSQCKSIHSVFEKIKEALRWNYLLDVFTSCYSDIALFSALEFSAPQFNFFWTSFSFILCISTNIVVVTILVIIIVILNKLASKRAEVKKSGQHRHLAALEKQLKNLEVVFGDFKDDSIFKQGYMVYFLGRLYLFYAIVGYLYLFPVVQAALLNAIGVITVAYLCIFRPFKDKWTLIGFIIEETIIEIVNVCVLTVAILDNMGVEDVGDSRRVVAGDIIIVCNFIFLAVALLYLFVQLIIGIRDIYLFFKKGANKKKKGLDIRSRTIDRSITALENSMNDTSLVINKSQSQTRQNLNPNNMSFNGIFNLEDNDSPRKKRRLPLDNQASFGNNRKQYAENGPFQHGNLEKINSQLPKSIKVNPEPERNPDPHRRYFDRMISLYAPTNYKTNTDYSLSQKKTHDKKSKKNKRT